MAQITPCCVPKFGSATEASQRPMSLRINPNAGDVVHLLSAWRDNKLCAIIQVTWGLILRCYMGSDDVCFGYRHVDANEQVDPTEGSPNTMQPITVQLTINEGDSIKTVLGRADVANAVDEGRNAIVDSYRLYNTVVLVRSYRPGSQETVESSVVSPSALILPQECLLRLHVKVVRENVRIFLEWRNDGMSMEHVKGIATLFQNLLTKVLSSEDPLVGNLNYFTDPDLQRISNWNGPSPQVHDRCIHDIIREQVIARPHDEAICAWDGSLSYRELDQQASKLAYHLQEQGVGPEVLVPLCFDKSMWYFVALLAVLKAGGAFVPLDPKHPRARLQSLIKKVNARLVLSSEWHADRLLGLTEVVIPLSQTTFDRIPRAPVGFISSDEVNCSNAAYVIFTSGSTGEPKGTLLEHRAYCSSAMVHGPRLLIFPDSRVLQFAAHTFDASLAESISPLMHGACVCIPSEDDRLNDIVGAIKRLRANYASLTPSFIEFIEPSMIPEVHTLILAGEAMSETHRAKWSTISLVNGFGPTEASVTAAINSKVTATTDCRDIGLPLNARCWIVNPDNHNQLAPVGAIGEMLLEGPTLARGYINNPSKTAEAFIYDPEFVRSSPISNQGRRRFYKTGDLVRYNSDSGSLTYVGRKDNQVKLHGQRVELGEVEACLNSDALVKHCVVLLPKEGYAQGKLTAVLSLINGDNQQSKAAPLELIPREVHKQSVSAMRERLSGRLPTYMVPAIWVSVGDMPFLPSRKLDRKGILTWLSGMNRNPYLAETATATAEIGVVPADDMELKLVQVWSRLLNIPVEQVPLNDSFLKLGGDSIAAMTCMNLCRKYGIAVTMQDVLRSSSVRDLASRAQATSNTLSVCHEEKIEEPFALSPIQALHFKVRQERQGHFNQSILTRINQRVEGASIRKAIDSLVGKHSMLRARFEISSSNEIQQRIINDVAGSYRWNHHQVDSESGVDLVVAASQKSISCFSGPLLAVDLVDIRGSKQVLSMVAHHLVVDIVSWRVILQDLEDALFNPSQDLAPYLPFQTWLELQRQHTKQIEERQPELETLPAPDFTYWGLATADIIYGDVACASFCLDENTTSRLMSECHTSLRTEPVDLLLAAMLFSFGRTFHDRCLPVIYNEGHGREPWDTTIDISRTVGWFTTLYPIFVEKPKDAIDAIVRVKDRRRQVSDNGRSSFTRRVLQPSFSQRAHDYPMEINLNYLGQHRDLQRPDGLFQLAQQMVGETREGGGSADFGRDTPRFSLFEVSAAVVGGRLRLVFSFSASMKRKDYVQRWVRSCQDVLESMAIQLPSLPLQRTLSDFPLLTMSYPELSLLQTQKLPRYGIRSIDEVEDIYPCSKMQQGVLLSQARDPMLYAVSGTWQVQTDPGTSQPDMQRLIDAWNEVVDHHAMLRTVFATGLSRRHPFSHIVLKKYTSTPVLLQCASDEDITPVLNDQAPADYRSTKPAHRLTICQSTSGTIVCKIELSHAVMDGTSISLLLRDLRNAYGNGIDEGQKPLFKDFIHHLQRQPNPKGINHWCDYLSGLQPCHLPSDMNKTTGRKSLQSIRLSFNDFDKLQSFCSGNNITVANAFNAAWSLTLAEFCQSVEVCFSYLTSLRDAPVRGIESMVGPIINLLPCRLRIDSWDVVDIARRIQDDYMENYPYRDISLIDIQHAMKSSRTSLFNTGVSYRKLLGESGTAQSMQFKPIGRIHDPAEVAVYVNIEATDTDAQLDLNYWSHWLSDAQAEKVANTFLRSLSDMANKAPFKSTEEPASVSDDNIRIGRWSRSSGPAPTHCVQALVEAQATRMPHSLAITAGERDMTYALLNEYSSALANYMINLGVLPGIEVPISFDSSDSRCAIIAILAIWKAGAVCVPLEMNCLSEDAEAWLLEADLQVALSSLNRAESLEEITPYVISVTDDFLEALQTGEYVPHQTELTDPAYIAFPDEFSKRIVLNHREVAASCSSPMDKQALDQCDVMPECASVSSYEFLVKAFGTLSRGGRLSVFELKNTREVLKEQLRPSTPPIFMTTSADEAVSSSPNISSIGSPALTPRYSQSSLSSISEIENQEGYANKVSTEAKLRHIWAEVLEVEPESINGDDSFFELGGDSLTAMSLGSAARAEGLKITVADIFAHPELEDMVKCCEAVDIPAKLSQTFEPFSLLPRSINREELLTEVASTCSVPKTSICDVYPCSALQEGLVTASFRQPGAYVANPVLTLARDIDIEKFKAAWQKTVDEIDILRTRIIHTASANFVQAVLKPSPINWDQGAAEVATRAGGPLAGYTIMDTGYSRTFTWSIHHSIYDGWSLPLVFGRVEENYWICQNASRPSFGKPLVSYSAFIDHLQKRDVAASENFWRTYLGGISAPSFPHMKGTGPSKIISSNRLQMSAHVTPQRKDVTLPALIRAAWAVVLSLHTESGDVCFGETIMGRNIDIPGAADIPGPLLTTVPTRIAVDSSMKVTDYLERVHQSTATIIPHQHVGLQRIRKLSKDTRKACGFQNLMVIQTSMKEMDSSIWAVEGTETNHEFFTYPLTVECKVSETVDVTAYFDDRVIPAWRLKRLLGQFSVVMNQLAATPQFDTKLLSDLEVVSTDDRTDMEAWNCGSPTFVDRTIHELIDDQRLRCPNSPSVASWDGNMSYQELFDTASGFANHLSELGVGPETLVPMCMDKSVWMIVTIMSILMAGGAFVPLDPAHPVSRHEEILDETGARILLCTPKYQSRYLGKVATVLGVDQRTVKLYQDAHAVVSRRATSSNVAYSIFTSGSTGRPKGIIIEHRAFASSTMAYGPIIHLKPGIRVFQFASLTFDAAVMEVLGTLIFGGCVCIPSDEERLNDISGAIRRLDASWLFCTPSLASIMEPLSVPSLKVIVCGGEMMSHEAMSKWSDKVHFINAYGPTETSVYATFNPNIGQDRNPANIGKTIPSTHAWIVDPNNHDRLYPVGTVGELALEGPVLAREYLKNPEKTASAFITNPKWAQDKMQSTSDRRIYLTGDLARLTVDGSLEYVGRKDNQVKLHGQRMELGEIEYRLHEHSHVRHVVIVLPKTGRLQKRLVAILSLNSLSTETTLISSAGCSLVEEDLMERQGMAELMEIQANLATQLPPYMVPQTWAVINALPMLVSGKIDRKKITNWIETVDDTTYNRVMRGYDKLKRSKAAALKAPGKDDTQTVLHEILAHVLNIPADKIDLGMSFTSIGGDSITGMALVSHARKRGITLSLRDILQATSVEELAKAAETGVKNLNQTEDSDSWFGLSAIQKFYFKYASEFKGSARFNQSITLQLPRRIEPSVIANGLKAITKRHPMLRARFRQINGKWEQRIVTPCEKCYQFQVTALREEHDLQRMIAITQNGVDLQNGPVFAANLFEAPGVDQILFLVANHLCVDMVSWRLILQDLEEFVHSGSLTPEWPFPFQSWCAKQLEHCQRDSYQNHIPFSPAPAKLEYWGMRDVPNCYGDVKMRKFSLSTRKTALALDKCHARLRTEPLDLLLAVLMHSFRRTFTDRDVPTVYNETHGRHPWDSDIDLSGTVGWFTSICPVSSNLASDDIIDTLRMVKETRHTTVNFGSSFFAQNVLAPQNGKQSESMILPFEIVFNYLGKLQQLERNDSLFQHYGRAYDENDFMVAGDMGPQTPRFSLFEVSAIVIRDQLQFTFTYNKNMQHLDRIGSWISECESTLYEALEVLQHDSQLEVVPSDYPLLSTSQRSLQTLFKETLPKLGVHGRDAVEDIYPCSSMQEGIMFSQLRDPSAYILHTIFNVKDTRNNQPINIPRLRKAWQMVVNRHSILRTIFIDSSSKDGSFDQVVLRDLHADMVELECDDSNILEQLNKVSLEETNRKHAMQRLHQITVCKSVNGVAVMKLEMNHAIIDGASVGVLLRDFSLAYERQLPSQPGPSYRDYIAHMRSHAKEEGVEFWARHLRGIQPCRLPESGQGPKELKSVKMDFHRFAELRQLGQKESITLANLILAAWAIVLREFTGTQDVCFGYLSAGRDAPVAGIQEAVGIFINMLCCRVQFSPGQSLADTYKRVQDDFFRSIPYQSCSLATVQNELGLDGQMLFNSALSIQNKIPSTNSGVDALSFDIQQAYDPSEFPVTVNAMTTQGGEGILLRYWSSVISDSQANLLVSSIARVFVAFIENSPDTIPAAGKLVAIEPERHGQPSPQGSLRRRGSVRSRSPRLSVSDPLIQQQIDQRVNEILSRMLNKEDLAKLQEPNRDAATQNPANPISSPDYQSEIPVSPVSRMSSVRRRFSTISRTSRRRMSMDLEKKLLMLWSSALNLSVDSIDRQDSFFSVGGDSVKAMKMASAARDEGLVMTVADVFRNPVFEDMLAVICSTTIVHTAPKGLSEGIEEEYPPDSKKVGEIIDDSFPSGALSRQSLHIMNVPDMPVDSLPEDICPKVGLFKGGIADVLPVTDFQALSLTAQLFESRWMLNYFYLDGEGHLDLKRLRESCARVVDAFDILRTVFVCSGANFYQVILKKARPSIAIYETQMDLDSFTTSLQQRDRNQGLPQGEQFVQFVVAKREGTSQHRLLIRMSHAQYDGMCVSKILEALKQGYEGGTLAPAMSYSSYMRLLPSAISADHYEYWTNLLKGSRMTEVVSRDHPNRYQTMGASTDVSTTINIAQNFTIGNITVGTLVQAAWALALARLSADADVVFGLTTNGRNASIPGVQDVVGPCLNIIPVRVTFGNRWTGLDLIRYLQDQLVATMPYESLGFREIIQRCTDWHCSTFFSTAVLHQNVDFEGHMGLDNNQYRVGAAGAVDNLADLTLVSRSVGANQINLTLGYSCKGPITEIFASRVLHLVSDTIVTLTSNPTAQLPSPTTLRSLPPQTVPDLPRIPDHEILTAQLKNQNISDILLHSAILSRTWQQVLPAMQSNQKTFQLDTSFYDLGGDVFALGQATWLLQQEGYQIRIEDLLDRPSFLGHMAVLAQDSMGQNLQEDTINAQREEAPTPAEKAEKKVRWKKALGIMGKFSKRESISS